MPDLPLLLVQGLDLLGDVVCALAEYAANDIPHRGEVSFRLPVGVTPWLSRHGC
jgi:hypothetical protein